MSVEIKNVFKAYQQGETSIEVLKGVSADILDGETVAILGQSGSGKSTLLSLLAGLDKPTSGEIFVNGRNISNLTEKEMTAFRAQNIGIVFQQFHLMAHLTALENVCISLEILGADRPEKKALEALEKMGLSHREKHFPSQLSGGECQRVAMARALVVNPKFLLADEPSGNLDVETGAKVMDSFFEIVKREKTTTVLVTHSEALAKRCDRQLVLVGGLLKDLRSLPESSVRSTL